MNKRLTVKIYRSNTGISVQLVDGGKIIIGKVFKFKKGENPIDQANKFGEEFGKEIQNKNHKKIIYDRGRFLYHGRVKSFADGMRSSGVIF